MSEENISGITKIAVKGFKSIAEECAIDIRPLTILAGANSSGKSSLMQPLLMLKQTLEAPYDPGPLLINGPHVKFTEAAQFLSIITGEKRSDQFQIRIETHNSDLTHLVETKYKKKEIGFEITEMTLETKQVNKPLPFKKFTLYPGMSSDEITALGRQGLQRSDLHTVKPSRCFLSFAPKEGDRLFNITYNFVESYLFDSIHLPGLRENPERFYQLSSTGPRYPGRFEHYPASILHEWQVKKDERLTKVSDAFNTLGLTKNVKTYQIGNIGIEVQVGRLPVNVTDETDMVNIFDVGLGVSQVLPVLVALIAANPGQLIYIEQPELHLHPNAQVALAQVLANAAKRGVRVVIETHSSLLLLGIQSLVAEGKLSPELVKLHWFSRNKEGITKIDSVDIDEAGTYGDWPVDFDDISLREQSRYIKASRSHLIEGT